jgi:hypothetical protein
MSLLPPSFFDTFHLTGLLGCPQARFCAAAGALCYTKENETSRESSVALWNNLKNTIQL